MTTCGYCFRDVPVPCTTGAATLTCEHLVKRQPLTAQSARSALDAFIANPTATTGPDPHAPPAAVKRTRNRPEDSRTAKAVALTDRGVPIRQAADAVGVDPRTITRARRRRKAGALPKGRKPAT